jgi:acyl transferase domain-containing protein
VNRVYEDGAKIFIEAGSGNVCSRWIEKILGNKEHMTVSLNRRGIDDHTSIIRALAKLLSHQVSLDLSSLYSQTTETSSQLKPTVKTVNLGGNRIVAKILSDENRTLFENVASKKPRHRVSSQHQNIPLSIGAELTNSFKDSSSIHNGGSHLGNVTLSMTKQDEENVKNTTNNSFSPREQLQSCESTVTQEIISQSILHPITTTQNFAHSVAIADLTQSQYQKLSANNKSVHKAHANFLKSRQEFSQQMSEIIQLQLACAENLLA